MQNENNSSSEDLYYSPTNLDSPTYFSENYSINCESPKQQNIIDCNCINSKDNCLIFCFNMDTNQFESIDCKIFNKNY